MKKCIPSIPSVAHFRISSSSLGVRLQLVAKPTATIANAVRHLDIGTSASYLSRSVRLRGLVARLRCPTACCGFLSLVSRATIVVISRRCFLDAAKQSRFYFPLLRERTGWQEACRAHFHLPCPMPVILPSLSVSPHMALHPPCLRAATQPLPIVNPRLIPL
jgi:hypothetical protein